MEEKLGRRLLMSEFFKLNNISQNRLYACYASGKMWKNYISKLEAAWVDTTVALKND